MVNQSWDLITCEEREEKNHLLAKDYVHNNRKQNIHSLKFDSLVEQNHIGQIAFLD